MKLPVAALSNKATACAMTAFNKAVVHGARAIVSVSDFFNRAARTLAPHLRRVTARVARIGLRGSLIAASLASAGVCAYGAVQVYPYSSTQDIKLLNECNAALRDNRPCSPAAAAEKARSNAALVDLGTFAAGMGGALGFAYAAFPMKDRRPKEPKIKK